MVLPKFAYRYRHPPAGIEVSIGHDRNQCVPCCTMIGPAHAVTFKKLESTVHGYFSPVEPTSFITGLCLLHELKKNKIHSFFMSIISRDDVINTKPDPDHLMKVLEELGSDPNNTLVIGDHPVDMECANNIGAHCIAVLNNRHGIEDFSHCKVNYFIKNISEFKELLNSKVKIMT